MKLKLPHYKRPGLQTGQSAMEFAIMSVVFVPLFLSVPILGKYIDIKQKTVESSRYAAWERTLWSDNGAGWNDGSSVNKSDDKLEAEIDQRFFGHPAQGIHDSDSTENPMWSMVEKGEKVQFLQGAEVNPVNKTSNVVRAKYTDDATEAKTFLNQAKPIGLATDNLADLNVKTPVKNALLGPDDLAYSAQSGILSNSWMARDEAQLRKRVGNITWSEPINYVIAPVVFLRNFSSGPNTALFGELHHAYKVEDALNRNALPDNRKGTDTPR